MIKLDSVIKTVKKAKEPIEFDAIFNAVEDEYRSSYEDKNDLKADLLNAIDASTTIDAQEKAILKKQIALHEEEVSLRAQALCRPAFADALDKAIRLADWHEVSLERPFVGMDKTAIVRRGVELGVPFALTWSCYVGGDRHCGKCGTCVERKEAFLRAGVVDPTAYVG